MSDRGLRYLWRVPAWALILSDLAGWLAFGAVCLVLRGYCGDPVPWQVDFTIWAAVIGASLCQSLVMLWVREFNSARDAAEAKGRA